jgi:hypothetical protein
MTDRVFEIITASGRRWNRHRIDPAWSAGAACRDRGLPGALAVRTPSW